MALDIIDVDFGTVELIDVSAAAADVIEIPTEDGGTIALDATIIQGPPGPQGPPGISALPLSTADW